MYAYVYTYFTYFTVFLSKCGPTFSLVLPPALNSCRALRFRVGFHRSVSYIRYIRNAQIVNAPTCASRRLQWLLLDKASLTHAHTSRMSTHLSFPRMHAQAPLSARTQRCMYMCLQMQVYVYIYMHTPTVRARQAQQARCCASSAKRRAALGRWACSVEQAVVRTRLGVYVYGMCMCMSMGVAMGV